MGFSAHKKLYTQAELDQRIAQERLAEAQWFWDNVEMRANDRGQRKAKERIANLQAALGKGTP